MGHHSVVYDTFINITDEFLDYVELSKQTTFQKMRE